MAVKRLVPARVGVGSAGLVTLLLTPNALALVAFSAVCQIHQAHPPLRLIFISCPFCLNALPEMSRLTHSPPSYLNLDIILSVNPSVTTHHGSTSSASFFSITLSTISHTIEFTYSSLNVRSTGECFYFYPTAITSEPRMGTGKAKTH